MVSRKWLSVGWTDVWKGCINWAFEHIEMVSRTWLSVEFFHMHVGSGEWSFRNIEVGPRKRLFLG